jgi:glycosyltransferase involved in cell wall biosynthesis
MKLTVISHKLCWTSAASKCGYATDGGFPLQMRAISELFDATVIVAPCIPSGSQVGEVPLDGHKLSVVPLTNPYGHSIWRKLLFPFWLLRNSSTLLREIYRSDAVHADIPGDIGTIGMLLAFIIKKPLFLRHCGNWLVQRTTAERFWKWFMERFGGGRNVAFATGGAVGPPSKQNPSIQWIFSTSLTEKELRECSSDRTPDFSRSVRLITVCRQEREKGSEVVMQSLPLILEQSQGVTLDVVGEGSRLRYLKQLATSLGLEDRIRFHGKVNHDQVKSLLLGTDLFCYPTTASEGFPKSVLEALACGLPVVTTHVSVLPALIGTGCGVLIDEATPAALALAVLDCIHDCQIYSAMSTQAKQTAWQYSLERWRDEIGGALASAWGPLKSDA